MRIIMLSISHQTASVDLREKLAVSGERLSAVLSELKSQYPAIEAVLLSTCNRTELYIARPAHASPTFEQLDQFMASIANVPCEVVTAAAIHREQDQAVTHLFRVASGIESMVLGEPQILGQVKSAYEQAQKANTIGVVFHKVFQQAINAAKQVRSNSGIDEGRVSVGSVAVDFAAQIFERFDDKTMIAIGAGEMVKLTLRHLQKLNPAKLWLTNRSKNRAENLAKTFELNHPNGGVRPFEELDQLLIETDIVLTSTGSQEPIITAERFKPLIRKRRSRPIFIVDIAVPRDVDPAVGQLSNVYLYNIDDLQRVVAKTYESRSAQIEQCEKIIFDAVRRCVSSVQNRDIGHLIRQLRDTLHQYGNDERKRTIKKLASTPADQLPQAMEKAMEEHDHRLVNKILHLPLSQLDQKNPDVPLAFYASALRRLFGLGEDGGPSADEHDIEIVVENLESKLNPKAKLDSEIVVKPQHAESKHTTDQPTGASKEDQ